MGVKGLGTGVVSGSGGQDGLHGAGTERDGAVAGEGGDEGRDELVFEANGDGNWVTRRRERTFYLNICGLPVEERRVTFVAHAVGDIVGIAVVVRLAGVFTLPVRRKHHAISGAFSRRILQRQVTEVGPTEFDEAA